MKSSIGTGAGASSADVACTAAGELRGARIYEGLQFFREPHHYSQLEIRARALARQRTSLSLWCCGCGTGEDAYSAAMVLREAGIHAEILATDAEGDALATQRGTVSGRHQPPLRDETGAEVTLEWALLSASGVDSEARTVSHCPPP